MTDNASGQENLVARALVRILDQSGVSVGFGLLVAAGKVVTCAHVVAQSMGEDDFLEAPPSRGRVRLDFPFLASGRVLTAEARTDAWQSAAEYGSGDVAGLVLDDEAPAGASPLALTRGGSVSGHDFLAYGYRSFVSGDMPTWVPGRIINRTEGGWLQLGVGELTGGLRIRQGFSGTPVWDVQNGQVVGLVTGGSRGQSEWLAYAVSGETIFHVWEELRESFRRACPFRGLVPYESGDSDVFFGRGELGHEAAQKIARSEHTVVSGASGAGKTSLINAAIIPELQRQGHAVVAIRPLARDSLWAAIAAAIAAKDHPWLGTDRHSAEDHLANAFAAESLQSRVARLCEALGKDRVVVVVDQFEEVLYEGKPRARRFTWDLGQLPTIRHPEGRPCVRVVIVIREDHEAELRTLPPYDTAASVSVAVGALTTDQLRAAIEGPVQRSGFARYEDRLVDRIIDEVHVQPYSLPALQVVLTELWETQSPDGVLRHSVYQDLNSGAGPLATHLEGLWQELGHPKQSAARRLFLHLVIPLGDNGFARRAASHTEMSADDWQIAGALATQRLLVLRASPAGGATAEFVHDALIDQWPALAEHLSAHRDFLQWRDDTRRRIAAWEQSGKEPSQLLSGSALNRSLAQEATLAAQLSQPEREFLELSTARRRRVRRRAFGFATTLLTVIAVLLAFAIVQHHSAVAERILAQQRSRIALSRQLVADALATQTQNPALARQLIAMAYRISPTAEARGALLTALTIPGSIRVPESSVPPFGPALAYSPDSRYLAVGTDGAVRIYEPSTGRQVARLPSFSGYVGDVAFSPDGRLLVAGDGFTNDAAELPGELRIWDVSDLAHPHLLSSIKLPYAVSILEISPDGKKLAAASGLEKPPRLWNISNPSRPVEYPNFAGGYKLTGSAIFFAPDGRRVLSRGYNGGLTLWNLASSGKLTHPFALPGTQNSREQDPQDPGAFSLDGKILVVPIGDSKIALWRMAGLGEPQRLGTFGAGFNVGSSLAFVGSGHLLLANNGTEAQIWDVSNAANPSQLETFTPSAGSIGGTMMLSPNGRVLATANPDDLVRLWNITSDMQAGALSAGQASVASHIVSDPAARPRDWTIMTSSENGAYQYIDLWDISDPARPRPLVRRYIGLGDGIPAISPDGKVLAIGYSSSLATASTELWDMKHPRFPELLYRIAGLGADALAFSPDGRMLAVSFTGGTAISNYHQANELWDVADPRHPRLLSRFDEAPGVMGTGSDTFTFSPDGRSLSTKLTWGIHVWDISDPTKPVSLGFIGRKSDPISYSAFTSDSRSLIAGDQNGEWRIWDATKAGLAQSGSVLLASPTLTSGEIALSPDGTLAVIQDNDSLRVWDISNPRQPLLLAQLKEAAIISFSPDGNALATDLGGENDGGVRIWDMNFADIARRLCDNVGTPMTVNQWNQYLPGEAYAPPCHRYR